MAYLDIFQARKFCNLLTTHISNKLNEMMLFQPCILLWTKNGLSQGMPYVVRSADYA
jgi:hypothetical protein